MWGPSRTWSRKYQVDVYKWKITFHHKVQKKMQKQKQKQWRMKSRVKNFQPRQTERGN